MKALEIKNKALSVCERPIPTPKDDEILIKVAYAGVNRPDLFQVAGAYPAPKDASDLPGLEVSGTIEAGSVTLPCGRILSSGDGVLALVNGGGYAEYVSAPKGQILPIPTGWTLEQAGALAETLFTVWANIGAFLEKDKTLLVHGGSSGIGHIAIQMAQCFGMRVATTVGNTEKIAFCKNLGTDLVINYKTQNFREHIEKTWGENPIDLVLDMVAGDYIIDHCALLAPRGHHVNIATLGGAKTTLDIRAIMKKRLTFTGSTLRPRSLTEKQALRDQIYKNIFGALNDGSIKPHLFETFPIDDANAAHAMMKESNHMGKITLKI